MLKFFRRIRQKLFTEAKFSRYFLYAIGEIVLVMIGILLALQVNNWNEGKKALKRQTEYLIQIQSEMSANRAAMLREKKELRDILDGLRKFISLKEKDLDTLSDVEVSKTWASIFSASSTFKYEDGVLSALISTGDIKEIVNDSIRQSLASWESKVNRVKGQETAFNSYLKQGNDYLLEHGSFRQIIDDCELNELWDLDKMSDNSSNIFLLKFQKFENIMSFAIATGATLDIDIYDQFEKELDEILDQIMRELK